MLVPALLAGALLTGALGAKAMFARAKKAAFEAQSEPRALAPPESPTLAQARSLRSKGKLDEASALLTSALTSATTVTERLGLLRALARVELASGKVDAAVSHFERALGTRVEGDRADAPAQASDAFALAFTLSHRLHRLSDARRVLDGARPIWESFAEGRAKEPYYEGLIALELGDYRTALTRLRTSAEAAEAAGLTDHRRHATAALTLPLVELGRAEEALAMLTQLEARGLDGATACERADVLVDIGWAALRSTEASMAEGSRPASPPDAKAPLLRALSLLEGPCVDAPRAQNAHVNLALVALTSGDAPAARQHLASVHSVDARASASNKLFAFELEARIALTENEFDRALAAFDAERSMAEGSFSSDANLRAELGRAEALTRLGRLADAQKVYREAEALLDDASQFIPMGEGRDSFVGQRDRAARGAIEVLLALGDAEEAMRTGERSRARGLRAMIHARRLSELDGEARVPFEDAIGKYRRERERLEGASENDWRLSEGELRSARAERRAKDAELRAELEQAFVAFERASVSGYSDHDVERSKLRDGEVVLLGHPTLHGWAVFAQTSRGIRVHRTAQALPIGDADALARELLAPFSDVLASADTVHVLAYGALRNVDVHALSFRNEPLLAHASVDYPVTRAGSDREAPRSPRALFVFDPRGDLSAARSEAERLRLVIEANSSTSGVWLSGQSATSRAVRDELSQATMFHYAGHGARAGTDGFESALSLADGSRLSVGDILALPHAPALVVLSACEGALAGREAKAEGLSLAHAFALAGTGAVVAATRRVDDELAAAFSIAFHEQLCRTPAAPPREVLRTTLLGLRRRLPESDWASFRIVAR